MNLRLASIPALLLLLAGAPSIATTYKCTLQSGQTEYRSEPCQIGNQKILKPPPSPPAMPTSDSLEVSPSLSSTAHVETGIPNRSRNPRELVLRGYSQPVALMIRNIASFSGNDLKIDPTIKEVGDFDFQRVDWEVALMRIADRFNLAIELSPGLITVKRR